MSPPVVSEGPASLPVSLRVSIVCGWLPSKPLGCSTDYLLSSFFRPRSKSEECAIQQPPRAERRKMKLDWGGGEMREGHWGPSLKSLPIQEI